MTISGIPGGAAPIQSVQGTQATRPAATPREPMLWAMLSTAERAFLLAPEGDNTVGYGPEGGATVAAPSLGRHLDVRG